MDDAGFARWRALRTRDDTRFLGLVLPRVLFRAPYGPDDRGRRDGFHYAEDVGSEGEGLLWGNAAFVFAVAVIRRFDQSGWFADLRGVPQDRVSGGLVTEVPGFRFATDAHGIAAQAPLEIRLSGVQEQQASELGLIPVVSAHYSTDLLLNGNASLHAPPRYDRDEATWNARISSMLQYVLCVSRFSHYLMVMMRDKVGGFASAGDVQRHLNAWMSRYCLGSDGATDEMRARFPLRDASVEVNEVPGRPGSARLHRPASAALPAGQHRHQLPPPHRPGGGTLMAAEATLPLADLLAEGRLSDAIAQVTGRLRGAPADAASRTTLAELLCLAGAFERAEAQLAIVAQQTTDRPVALARMRHLIRAALAREAWFRDAAVPALLAEPTELQRLAMALALAVRAGDAAAVAAALDGAEAARPRLAGEADGSDGTMGFDDLRDVDDGSAWFLEILTHDGNYMWTDLGTVEALSFTRPRRPIDLLWREARMTLRDGRVADIAVPAQYVAPAAEERHRVALATDWEDGPGGTARGIGQRVLLLGDAARPILEIDAIRFQQPAP